MITTNEPATYKVHPKEETYFAIKVFFSVIGYYLIFKAIQGLWVMGDVTNTHFGFIFLIYGILIVLYLLFLFIIMVGYLKGNAIKVSPRQFPDVYNIAVNQAAKLGMATIPDVYILQAGGVLNAFATRFVGTNYIVIYSDVLAAAYEQDIKVVEFIIGHEMGHIKRKHITKRLLLLPGALVPFLGSAYSRACEYTCDRIGFALCPEGARPGMLLLAAGRGLSKKINVAAYTEQIETEDGFIKWMSEKFASHPNLTKRVRAFGTLPGAQTIATEPITLKDITSTDDHSKFLPK